MVPLPSLLGVAMLAVTGCASQESSNNGPTAVTNPTANAAAARAVRAQQFPLDRGFTGVISTGASVYVEPEVGARIVQLYVAPGDSVSRGQRIAKLDTTMVRLELRGARVAALDAARKFKRRQHLAAEVPDAITKEELESARAEYEREQARAAALAEQVQRGLVVAPVAGTISERYLEEGAVAAPGKPIVKIVERDRPQLRFAVSVERARGIARGTILRVEATAARTTAIVEALSPEVDSASGLVHGTASLSAAIENAAILSLHGLPVRLFVDAEKR